MTQKNYQEKFERVYQSSLPRREVKEVLRKEILNSQETLRRKRLRASGEFFIIGRKR